MTNPPDDTKPQPVKQEPAPASEPVALQDEMLRVLFDHEMERGMTITKLRQPRRRIRMPRE